VDGDCCQRESDPAACFLGNLPGGRFQLGSGSCAREMPIWRRRARSAGVTSPESLRKTSFNGLFSRTTRKVRKGKTSLDLNEASDDGFWDAVASAGPYASNLHLAAYRSPRQHLITHFYGPDALHDAQPTATKSRRQRVACGILKKASEKIVRNSSVMDMSSCRPMGASVARLVILVSSARSRSWN